MTAPTNITLNAVSLAAAVPEALVVSVARQLVGARRHSRVAIPGRAGSWTFDEEPGDRRITIDVDIQGDTFEDRRTAVRELAYWVDIGTTSRLVIDDEPDRFHEVILADAPNVDEWLLRGQARLEFTAAPYAYITAVSTENITAGTNPDSGTFSIPDRVTAEPVVEITANAGTITAFTLTVNGYALTWAGTLGAGDTITISSISDTVTTGTNGDVDLTGTFDVNDLDMTDVSGEFPLLIDGTNTWAIVWTGTATSATLDFTWRERTR